MFFLYSMQMAVNEFSPGILYGQDITPKNTWERIWTAMDTSHKSA
jgi:hypothetical protein